MTVTAPTTDRTTADADAACPPAAERAGLDQSRTFGRTDAPGRLDAFGPLVGVSGADLEVPLVDGRSVRYANLDYAASAPALDAVLADQQRILPYYASVHRGAGYASAVSTALYEQSRRTVADFVGARDDDLTIFTRNTTDALNLLAGAVPAGSPVVCLDIEHHANLLPWQGLGATIVKASRSLTTTLDDLDRTLQRTGAGLLAITGASNVTGEVLPLARLADLAHRHGARLAVDGAQLVPHRRVDLAATGIDYLVFSGHKLYAPFGSGALIGRADWLESAPPYLAGGGAVRKVTVEHTDWADGVARHEGGTPNVLGAAAVAAACRAIAEIGDDHLRRHEWRLRTRLLSRLAGLREVRLLSIWDDCTDAVGVVGFTVDSYDAGLVAAYLSAEHGIGVRDGAFCAHPLAARLGLTGGALRVSFGVGSGSEDIDRLLSALQSLVEDGPQWRYELVDSRYQPVGDPRPKPAWLDSLDAAADPCRG
ncbi:aminotransferase class V-fold PLP-dependent enzyme [Microlunatus soli]|uniref:Selenocysteine lyase/Cysteine desulfurase n=1 Tax=Microlunatus soli TaxID=630515 RepID=A0A1H1RA70_9ACTN|nr:aminotransferase class V-fold PLP-dependent enzyme [Microlunatus soli]SDS32598.1 Selenocysteine lyase/Cysteine desulfurase [Microlunatus soli]